MEGIVIQSNLSRPSPQPKYVTNRIVLCQLDWDHGTDTVRYEPDTNKVRTRHKLIRTKRVGTEDFKRFTVLRLSKRYQKIAGPKKNVAAEKQHNNYPQKRGVTDDLFVSVIISHVKYMTFILEGSW